MGVCRVPIFSKGSEMVPSPEASNQKPLACDACICFVKHTAGCLLLRVPYPRTSVFVALSGAKSDHQRPRNFACQPLLPAFYVSHSQPMPGGGTSRARIDAAAETS